MKIGDLVRVTRRSSATALWNKIGVVLGHKRRYEPGKTPLVRVLVGSRERLFESCSLEIINENR